MHRYPTSLSLCLSADPIQPRLDPNMPAAGGGLGGSAPSREQATDPESRRRVC